MSFLPTKYGNFHCFHRLYSKLRPTIYLTVKSMAHWSPNSSKARSPSAKLNIKLQSGKQVYKNLLILDFEATCDEKIKLPLQEVIEFPCINLDTNSLQEVSVFHSYVQPTITKQLTPFCTELTGITQSNVEGQPTLEEALVSFDNWMNGQGLLQPEATFTFVTCGNWDLQTLLEKQCRQMRIEKKPYFSDWINLKNAFADFCGLYPRGMMHMLNHLGIAHIGRHHNGLDDTRNISNIVKALIRSGFVFSK